MKEAKDYREIVPGKKWFATLVTRVFFYFIGMGMQTAYRIDPDVKKKWTVGRKRFPFEWPWSGPQHADAEKGRVL